jgi:hypothetical protein
VVLYKKNIFSRTTSLWYNLENMFDEFISKIPHGFNLWCNISNKELNQYITQIGGFTDLPIGICPNTKIRIFDEIDI